MRAEDEPVPARVCECPRCGYDLTGMVASWHTECPVRGTCSECGLDFAWGDVLCDRLYQPSWSFEHGRRASLGRFVSTFVRVAFAPGAWRGLRLERRVVPGRLALFGVGAYLVLHAGFAAPAAWCTAREMWMFPSWTPEGMLLAVLWRGVWPYYEDHPLLVGAPTVLVLLWTALHWLSMPLLMLVLDETFRRVRVRRAHLARGAAYSVAPLVLACGVGVAWMVAQARSVVVPSELLALLLVTLATGAWWHRFVRSYLRLPRAGVITGVLTGVTVLASFTTILWLSLTLDR